MYNGNNYIESRFGVSSCLCEGGGVRTGGGGLKEGKRILLLEPCDEIADLSHTVQHASWHIN